MASSETEEQRELRALKDYARTTDANLYKLLFLNDPSEIADASPLSDADIRSSWRKAARTLHPDRNRGDEKAAAERMDAAQKAYAVLIEPEARAVYDEQRAAKAAARAEREKMTAARRAMVERLENAERAAAASRDPSAGVKRARASGEESESERQAREWAVFEADQARKRAEWVEEKRARIRAEAAAAKVAAARVGGTQRAFKSDLANSLPPGLTPRQRVDELWRLTKRRLRDAARKQQDSNEVGDKPVGEGVRQPISGEPVENGHAPRFGSFKGREGAEGASQPARERDAAAERARLEAQIRAEEAAEDAAAAAAAAAG